MNYLKIYSNLTSKVKNNKKLGGEKHHILPKSIFNSKIAKSILKIYTLNIDDSTNVVYLSFKEHYLSHALLVKIFEKINKNCYRRLLYAYNFMSSRGNKYHIFRKKFIETLRENMIGKPSRAKGHKWSEESKINRKLSHYLKGKIYEEIYGEERTIKIKEMRKLALLKNITKKSHKKTSKTRRKLFKENKLKIWNKGLTKETDGRLDYIRPRSWIKGHIPHSKGKIMPSNVKRSLLKSHKNKIWITNKFINKLINKKELNIYLKSGFIKGRTGNDKKQL